MAQSFYKATAFKDSEFFGDSDSVDDNIFTKTPNIVKPSQKRKFEAKPQSRRDISFYRNQDNVSREIVRNSILGIEQPLQAQLMLERSNTQDKFV